MQVINITFGYSDSEDRLWTRLILKDGGEAFLWLTRRLTEHLCQAVVQMIEKHTSAEELGTQADNLLPTLKKEYYEISRTTWDPSPPKADNSHTISTGTQVCTQVTINKHTQWELIFRSNKGNTYELGMQRKELEKILAAFLLQGQKAQWHLQINSAWLQ